MLKLHWGVCISLHICLVLLDFGDDSLGLLGSLWLIRCLESGWCLGIFVCIIPSLTQELLRLQTFWGLHSRMGGLLLGLWGVCWPRCRFGSFFQPQRVMAGPQLWWQKTFTWCSKGLFLESEGYQLHSNLYYRGLFWRWCSCYLLLPAHWLPLLFSHCLYRSWVSFMYIHNRAISYKWLMGM